MDQSSPDQKNVAKPVLRWPVIVGSFLALGLIAGAAIGAARIYGGGDAPVHAASADTASAACTATAAYQEAVDPFLTGDVAAMLVRDEPENLSGLAFNNDDGVAITLADTGDRVRLINLWATWCAPCREEMPWLETMQEERGGDDFEVVAISVDGGSDGKPRAFLEEIEVDGLNFYHDPTIGVFNDLRRNGLALGLPVTILVDEDGCVIANMNGPAHWSSPDAFALIDAALAARPGS